MGADEILLNISFDKSSDNSSRNEKSVAGRKRKIKYTKPQCPPKKIISEYDAALFDTPFDKSKHLKERENEKIRSSVPAKKNVHPSNLLEKDHRVPVSATKGKKGSGGDIASLVREACGNGCKEITSSTKEFQSYGNSGNLFSGIPFTDSRLHPYLVDNIKKSWNIEQMTEVQSKAIEPLLDGKDVLVHWQTGSGKTLAYALPLIHRLAAEEPKLTRADGIRAVIVLPTRELALQTYQIILMLVKSFAWLVVGCVVGGERRKAEKARLRRGLTIVVGTPTRLLDHVESTAAMRLGHINTLVLDEADRLIELGYQQYISMLIKSIEPSQEIKSRHQTVLLSATLTPGVENLAGLALSNPVRIADSPFNNPAILPSTLTQRVIFTPVRLRLVALASLIAQHLKEDKCDKVMVFAATQDMVDCLEPLLTICGIPTNLFRLHGSMSQVDRTQVFAAFKRAKSGVLIATDVAGRGLDIPAVGAVIQFTGPFDIADYVHRVGRTARTGHSGQAILVLTPNERPLIDILANHGISVQEEDLGQVLKSIYHFDFPDKKPRDLEDAATSLQLKLETAVEQDKDLHNLAVKGFTSFVRFYATYPRDLRKAFDKRNLHLGHYAKSFALREPPSALMPSAPPFKRFKSVDKFREKSGKLLKPLSNISEYSSGLEDIIKRKKKKKS